MTNERELKNLAHGRGKGKPVLTKGETSPPFQSDQCANCKKKSCWKNECPKRNPREGSKVLELEELDDLEYWGSTPHCNPEGRGEAHRLSGGYRGTTLCFETTTGATFRPKDMGTRGNRHQALSMDYPKKGGLVSGAGNRLIYGHPWSSIPPAGKRPTYQNGSPNLFWPRGSKSAG